MIVQGVELDSNQKELCSLLDGVITSVNKAAAQGLFSKLVGKILPKKHAKNSIYMYGGVGRGKSMIAEAFYQELRVPKVFMHYQNFMQHTHSTLRTYNESAHDVIIRYAKDLARQYRYICIDEFEVHDIADAMIISRLFAALNDAGVGILITSNTPPESLYKNGLQREQFLPFIDIIQKDFLVFSLDGGRDYRLDKIKSTQKVFYPITDDVTQKLNQIKLDITGGHKLSPTILEIFGRQVIFQKTHKKILITSFSELCTKPFSSNDFVEIGKYFTIIIMENVPYIGKDETDIAIRFINFIDNVYFRKIMLFISLEDAPEKIYPEGKRVMEFKRTISRLHEIESESYGGV